MGGRRRISLRTPLMSSLGECHEVHLVPHAGLSRSAEGFRGPLRKRLGDAADRRAVRSAEGASVPELESRRTRLRGESRLRRRRHQRASPERLRLSGVAEPDRVLPREEHEGSGDRDPRQHAAVVQPADSRGGRDCVHRLPERRTLCRRHAGRLTDGRGALLRHHADADAPALLRSAQPDQTGVDARRPVPLQRQVHEVAQRERVAETDSETASADLAGGRRFARDMGFRCRAGLHVQLSEFRWARKRRSR